MKESRLFKIVYYLLDDFVLEKAVLSEKEKEEILSALQSMAAIENACGEETLEKLSAMFRVHSENWCEVDFSRWGNQTQDNEKFNLLKKAIIHHRCVQIEYAGVRETQSERKIQPLKLLYKSRSWYLNAYCTQREDFRTFKLNRILKLKLLEEEFNPVPFPGLQDGKQQNYENGTLCFPKEMAYRVYDEFGDCQISKQGNGDLIVSARMPQDAWLTGTLLSFGTQVRVIEPAYLRRILAEQAKEIYEANKS